MDEPLLLHSLLEHRELIFGCLEAAAPRRIVEIGSETGGFTKAIVDWAAEHGATLTTIEPFPTPEIRRLAEANPHFELVEGLSPAALEKLEPADAYIVDGDHNYWTVSRELELIFRNDALAILHDVGWPCARRDQYYAPDALPPEAVHPHSFDRGRHPASHKLIEGGFRGAGQFAVALEEGGPRNGVLTAVEDLLATRPDLVYRQVAPVFGVGFVYPKDAPYARQVAGRLRAWHENELIERIERNRVLLFAELLSLQDALGSQRLRHNRAVLEYEDRLAAARAEIDALRLERARLRAQVEATNGAQAAR